MSRPTDRYAVSFRGGAGDRVREAFGDQAIETVSGVTTVICHDAGADAVQRVLGKLCDLGLEPLDVRLVGPVPAGDEQPPDGDGFRVAIRGALTIDHITCLDDPSEVHATDDVLTLVARDSAELSRLMQLVHDNGLALIEVERRDRTRAG